MSTVKLLFSLLFMVSSITTRATTWEIEVGGGGGNGTPYFAPQNLSIMQDDVVEWNWVSGIHNVLSMSGPVSFASDTHFAPTHMHLSLAPQEPTIIYAHMLNIQLLSLEL